MARLNKFTIMSGLVAAVSAQSSSAAASVTQVFIPFADQQPLVASVVAQSGDVKTMVIQCASGTGSDECGFPEPITYTAGPSTVHFKPSGIYEAVGEYDCKITGTSVVACALTEGLYGTVSDDEYITTPAASSSTTSATASGTDVTFIDVTITAGARSNGGASAGATSSSSGASTRSTGASSSVSGASGTTISSSASGSATSNSGSHLSGVAALMLAVPLLLL